MNLISYLLCGLLILSNLSGATLAQKFAPSTEPPPESKIQSWLRSEDPQSVAWGAHYALATKDQALVSDLLSVADSWQSLPNPSKSDHNFQGITPEQLDRRDATAGALDALIQMDAPVPVDTLRNLAADFPNYVAILLSRLPRSESQSLSFDLYRGEPQGIYSLLYISAALLTQDPPSGFAADLFSSIRIRASIFVIAPGAGPFSTGGGGHDCVIASSPAPRQQWPNFGIYQFSQEKNAPSFLVVSGIDPIYAVRSETTHYSGDSCAGMISLGPEERRRLLAQMLNVSPETMGWETETVENIEFKTEPQFTSDLQGFVAAQQEKYRATAALLVAKGLMTTAEQEESLPELEIHLNDMRGRGYSPVAALSPLPAHVSWSDSPWR